MDDDAVRAQRACELDDLRNEITRLAGHLNAANYRFLKLIAEFDRRNGWVDNVTQSCAHWLNWKCGIDLGAAREKVRVARALEGLPKISAAMERGEISYSNVRAISRVACAGTEDYFLQIARHGTAAHVERMVRHYRNAKAAEELSREARQQLERSVTYSYNADGSLLLRARLPAEVGAIVLKALEAAIHEIPSEQVDESLQDNRIVVDEETGERKLIVKSVPSARRADALGLVAESFLKHGPACVNGGDQTQVVVHVSAETLRDGSAGCCEFEDGPSMSAETARRLSCDAGVVALIEDENNRPLNVGRKTRTISPALRRLLKARDNGCRFPGCTNTRHVDAHHIKHWVNGGDTRPSNLVSLCSFHHRKVHEGGIDVRMLDDGAVRFVKPDGTAIESTVPLHSGNWTQLPLDHAAKDIHINERTAATRWTGERCNYALGIEVVLNQWRRTKHASATPAWMERARELGILRYADTTAAPLMSQ
ncbi:MAG: DUF222 domain-containing protein [Steroidobacteraceae bacterium]